MNKGAEKVKTCSWGQGIRLPVEKTAVIKIK